MKKIGYIIYCIIIIVISITINVFIGNSDRKLDYIMNDVVEHLTCEEEETCVVEGGREQRSTGPTTLLVEHNTEEEEEEQDPHTESDPVKDNVSKTKNSDKTFAAADKCEDVLQVCKDRIYSQTWATPNCITPSS
jgi:hypothetical protein